MLLGWEKKSCQNGSDNTKKKQKKKKKKGRIEISRKIAARTETLVIGGARGREKKNLEKKRENKLPACANKHFANGKRGTEKKSVKKKGIAAMEAE